MRSWNNFRTGAMLALAACLAFGTACGEEVAQVPPGPEPTDAGHVVIEEDAHVDPEEDAGEEKPLGAPCNDAGDCDFGLICHQGHCLDTTRICGIPDIDDINAGNRDSDCDGLTDAEEYSARFFVGGMWVSTDPDDPDTDDDGILDGVEMGKTASPDPCCLPYFVGDADPRTTTTPVNDDSDGDGIKDGVEDANRDGKTDSGETDPNKTDTDGDGIPDDAELAGQGADGQPHGHGATNPTKADTDGDGCLDAAELARGLNPNDPGDCHGDDTDGDGLSDAYEAILGTDPNSVDTDGDGLTDGDEINTYGTEPTVADSDGDGLTDGQEINTYKTDPNKPDSDGDGLSDGQEVRLGTNPNKKDTDGDGCEDGYEIQYAVQFGLDPTKKGDCPPPKVDSDCDGLTDAEESALGTNPNKKDTDGDGLWDGYEAGVTFNPDPLNCDQQTFLNNVYNPNGVVTNPSAKDSDGDGISDSDEARYGTDPTNPDTDGDGLSDYAEVVAGTNPAKADSDGDGISDGAEVIGGLDPLNPSDGQSGVVNQACAKPRDVLVHQSKDADISLVTAKTFTSKSTIKVGGKEKGVMAMDGTNKVVVFAIELPSNESTIVAQETAGRTKVANTGALSSAMAQSFTSWDGYPASIGYYEQDDSGTDLLARANAIIDSMLGSSASGKLSGTAGVKGPFKMQVEYLHRKDSSKIYRTIAVGSIVPKNTAASNETALLEMTDVGGGSSLAQYGDNSPLACEKLTSTGNSAVDFIWVVDYSFSMDQWQNAVAQAADTMAQQLNNAPVDWRVAVIYHDTDRASTQVSTTARKNAPNNFTTDISAFKTQVKVTSNGYNPERMFAPVKQMLEHESTKWLPATTSASATKLRKDAKVVVVWLSDANEQSVWGGVCDNSATSCASPNGKDCIAGVTCPYTAPTNPARLATTQEWINYFSNLPGGMGKAFVAGIVPPVGVKLNAEETVSSAYRDVITSLGGIEMDIRNTASFSQGISQIMTSAVGQATSNKLKKPPVAASIKVALSATTGACGNKADVPRSRTNGFDFDGTNQTLVFYGACRPTKGAQIAVSYRYWDDQTGPNPSYDTTEPNCKAPLVANALGQCVCSDCGGCGGGLSCNRTSCTCECPSDCNGACSGNFSCDTSSCGCVCNMNMTCGDNRVWDKNSCDCVCPTSATSCTGGRVFSQATCSCECAVSCGANEILDPATCECGCAASGDSCAPGYSFDEESCSCVCDMSKIDCSALGPNFVADSARCGCVCADNCGDSCAPDETCNMATCGCVAPLFQ